MSSTKIQKIIKKTAKENKEMFDSLIDYEKTGKISSKTRMNFTIDKDLARKFKNQAKTEGYSMSAKIETAIRKVLR